MSGTNLKSQTDLMQELVTALLVETKKLGMAAAGKSAETVNLKSILESTGKIREIHNSMAAAFNPSDGRSRILERFFVQWNNMLFGIFYVAGELSGKGFITRRQFEILSAAAEEIIKNMEKNPQAPRMAPQSGEKPAG
jgi:hypothetical protein